MLDSAWREMQISNRWAAYKQKGPAMSQIFFRSFILAFIVTSVTMPKANAAGEETIQLKFSGGDETDPRDRGRPVALVAGGLGVAPQVFRDAFRQVKPAPAGQEPEPAQVRQNKAALMAALSKYKVTNDELDRVSNFYRYPPGGKKSWPMKSAAGYAVVVDGTIKSVVITEHGFGYNAAPAVSVPGHPALALEAKLDFNRDLKKNGSVSSVTPAAAASNERLEPGQILPPSARAKLNLTAAQEKEIDKLQEEARARLLKILTAEQKKKLESPQANRAPDPRSKDDPDGAATTP